MSIESKLSGHWTDDELIQHLYGVGPEGGHLDICAQCRERLSAAEAQRRLVELPERDTVDHDFLMAQRRRVYARLSQPANRFPTWRWAPAAATLLVLAGGFFVYDQKFSQEAAERRVSDVELARDVSCMASDGEPRSTAPLQALFE